MQFLDEDFQTFTSGLEVRARLWLHSRIPEGRGRPRHEGRLGVLHDIKIEDVDGGLEASGGTPRIVWPWTPKNEDLIVLSFQHSVPTGRSEEPS